MYSVCDCVALGERESEHGGMGRPGCSRRPGSLATLHTTVEMPTGPVNGGWERNMLCHIKCVCSREVHVRNTKLVKVCYQHKPSLFSVNIIAHMYLRLWTDLIDVCGSSLLFH